MIPPSSSRRKLPPGRPGEKVSATISTGAQGSGTRELVPDSFFSRFFPCAAGIPNEREVSEHIDDGTGHDDGRKSDIHGENDRQDRGGDAGQSVDAPGPGNKSRLTIGQMAQAAGEGNAHREPQRQQ